MADAGKIFNLKMHSNSPEVMFPDVSAHTSMSNVFVKFALDVCPEKKFRVSYIRGCREL